MADSGVAKTLLLEGATAIGNDILPLFFENKRKTGGGEIHQLKVYHEAGLVAITYKEQTDADEVLSRQPFEIQGKTVRVRYDEDPRCVQITNISPKIDQDLLELYLENPRKIGGGPIDRVDLYSRQHGVAIVTFREHKVAQQLIFSKDPIVLQNSPLVFSPRTIFQDPRKVRIQGLKPQTNKEFLGLFFESKKMSGGGDIENIDFNVGKNEAVITFSHKRDAASVLAKDKLVCNGVEINASQVLPDLSSLKPKTMKKEDTMEEEADPSVVMVTGLKKTTPKDFVQYFFENEKKTDGGEVLDVQVDVTKGSAIVKFAEEAAAARVLRRTNLELDGARLTVSPGRLKVAPGAQPGPEEPDGRGDQCDPRVVVVDGIKPGIPHDFVQMFFESERRTSGGKIKALNYQPTKQRAVITYEEQTVAQRVLQRHDLTLDSVALSLSPADVLSIPKTPRAKGKRKTIIVEDIASTTTKDTLKMFFESKKRTDGGDIEEIDYDEKAMRCAITFRDEEVAEKILSDGRDFVLDSSHLTVHEPEAVTSKLRIRGIQPTLTYDSLMCFLELTKRSGGGPIKNLQYSEGSGTALVEFIEEQTVDRMLARAEPLELEDSRLSLSLEEVFMPAPKLLVSGINPRTTEAGLKLYFEHPSRSGGGEVRSLKFDKKTLTAVVEFDQQEAVERLLKMGENLVFDGSTLDLSELAQDSASHDQPASKVVLVEGIKPSTSQTTVQLFFEAPNKSGGGDIARLEYDQPNGKALITFTNRAVTERVLQPRATPLSLEGATLTISTWVSAESRQVVLTGWTAPINDTLRLFLESPRKCDGGDTDKIEMDRSGNVLVTYKEEAVAKRVLHTTKPLVIDGKTLTVSKPGSRCDPVIQSAHPSSRPTSTGPSLSTNVVVIDAIGPHITAADLQMFIESRKHSGGGPTQSVRYVQGSGSATVTYENPADAQNVLSRSPFDKFNCHMIARRPDSRPKMPAVVAPKPPLGKRRSTGAPGHQTSSRLVEIVQLPQSIRHSELRDAIGNTLGARGEFDIKMDTQQHSAVIEFNQSQDASSLVRVGKVMMTGTKCQVFELFDASNIEPQAIKVMGFGKDESAYIIELFFCNPNKSGGGNLSREMYYDTEAGIAAITYDSPQSVKNVMQRHSAKPLQIQGCKVTIKVMKPNKFPKLIQSDQVEPKMYYIHGAMEVCLQELNDFLMCTPSKGVASDIWYGMDGQTMLISMQRDIDCRELFQLCVTHPLRDRMVTIEQVPASSTIQVHNATSTNDQLRGYFSAKHAGGGRITDLQRSQADCLLITYENTKVANSVRKEHNYGGVRMIVEKYYPLFGITSPKYDASKPWSYIPDPFVMILHKPYFVYFLNNSDKARSRLDDRGIREDLFKVNIAQSKDDSLTVECLPQRNQSGNLNMLKRDPSSWESSCKRVLAEIIHSYVVKTVSTLDNVFQSICDEASKNIDKDSTVLKVQRDQATLIMVGWEKETVRVFDSLTALNKTKVEKLMKEKDSVEDTLKLESFQAELMNKSKALDKYKDMFSEMKITLGKEELKMKGVPEQIQTAKDVILENVLNSITMDDYDCRNCQTFLQTKAALNYLEKVFKDQDMIASFRPSPAGLSVYAMSQDVIKDAKAIIKKHVVDEKIVLNDENRRVVQTAVWKRKVSNLPSKHKELCLIEERPDEVVVACAESVRKAVLAEVHKLLKDNALHIESMSLHRGEVHLLARDGFKLLQPVKDQFPNSELQFQVVDKTNNSSLKISANSKEFSKIKIEVENQVKKILTYDYDIDKPWTAKYYQSQKGKDDLSQVESKHTVTCVLIDPTSGGKAIAPVFDAGQDFQDANQTSQPLFQPTAKPYTMRTREGITIQLVKGLIEKQQVDAVMNTPKETLDMHSTAVSTALSKAGGSKIADECKNKAPKGIKFGEVLRTGGGKLSMKAVYHAPCVHWNQGKDGEDKMLRQMIHTVLGSAGDDDMTSLAMPAVGTGNLKWPHDLVAQVLTEEIRRFSAQYPASTLRDIRLVLYDKDTATVKAFEKHFDVLQSKAEQLVQASSRTGTSGPPAIPMRTSSLQKSVPYRRGTSTNAVVTQEDITVTVKKGSIVKENCGALLNTTSRDLDLSLSGVSRAILEAGGPGIQQECRSVAPISVGDVVATSGGRMKAAEVYHTALCDWDPSNATKMLSEVLRQCFYMASQAGHKTLAVPAVGTGNLHYPAGEVARLILDEVAKYSRQNPSTSLTDITVVLYDGDTSTIQAFDSYLDSVRRDADSDRLSASGTSDGGAGTSYGGAGPAWEDEEMGEDEGDDMNGDVSVESEDAMITSFRQISSDLYDFDVGGIHMKLEKGDITKASTQAIVNSTTKQLDNTQGALAKAILKAAGPDVAKECQIYVDKHGEIQSVAETSGGRLPCQLIFHVCVESVAQLKTRVVDALTAADRRGLTSITLPALGTGQLKVSPADMTRRMMDAVADFSATRPQNLTAVHVRIYEDRVFSVFTQIAGQMAQDLTDGTKTSATQGKALPVALKEIAPDRFQTKISSVEVIVEKGDITKSRTDAVVSSTNNSFDVTQGGVATAIRKAAGKGYEKELKDLASNNRSAMRLKTRGGNLHAKNVIHVVACDKNNQWEGIIHDTLEYADQENMASISFPALGTGQLHLPPDALAHMMLTAIKRFAQQGAPRTLRLVTVVIYDDNVLAAFRKQPSKKVFKMKSAMKNLKKKVLGPPKAPKPKPSSPSSPSVRLSLAQPVTKISLRVYAMTQDNLDAAKCNIETISDGQTCVKEFTRADDKKLIQNLSRNKVKEIESLADQYDIVLDRDAQSGQLKIEGPHVDVMMCNDAIHNLLRKAEVQEKHAEVLYKQLRWEYETSSGFSAYPAEISCTMETASEDNKDTVEWSDPQLGSWRVNFTSMTAQSISNPSHRVAIRRTMEGASAIQLPSTWTRMSPELRFERVPLQITDPEYQTVAKGVHQTNTKVEIIKIERVQCPSQYQSYHVKLEHMKTTCPPGTNVELTLYHGTSADVIESINTSGFNRSYCGKNATRFGRGVYFAVKASYSTQTKYAVPDKRTGHCYLYQCKVLSGQYTKGNSSMIVPPAVDPSQPNILYDSVVDDVNNINMYVVFYDCQAYPEYLITYKHK